MHERVSSLSPDLGATPKPLELRYRSVRLNSCVASNQSLHAMQTFFLRRCGVTFYGNFGIAEPRGK